MSRIYKTQKANRTERLIRLFHYSWSIPLIAELHQTSGAKFVRLVHRLQISRDALSRTLDAHMRDGWLARNPGYGHPMRPEYILTSLGKGLGSICQKFLEMLHHLKIEEAVALRKWSMPIVFVMCGQPSRFSELKERLPEVTPRALTQALKDLQSAGLVDRLVQETYPPTARYRLTSRGQKLCSLLKKFADVL